MEIKAINGIIEWDAANGRMAILNAGDVAEVGDDLAKAKIEAGDAEPAKAGKKKAAPAGDAEPATEETRAAEATEAP